MERNCALARHPEQRTPAMASETEAGVGGQCKTMCVHRLIGVVSAFAEATLLSEGSAVLSISQLVDGISVGCRCLACHNNAGPRIEVPVAGHSLPPTAA